MMIQQSHASCHRVNHRYVPQGSAIAVHPLHQSHSLPVLNLYVDDMVSVTTRSYRREHHHSWLPDN